MSKPSEQYLLVPGETGWELWSGSAADGFTLQQATTATLASEIPDLPSGGHLTMLFPVKSVIALPMKVVSTDPTLIQELATMHAERLGLRCDPDAGQLSDVFEVAQDGEQSAILSVVLNPPAEGELPARSPQDFDLSARVLPWQGDELAVWKEFSNWVFAIVAKGKLLYCQATSLQSAAPDDALVREIKLAMIQLSYQGLTWHPTKVHLWSSQPEGHGEVLMKAFEHLVDVVPRPGPVLPSSISKLLPADVRAARRNAVRRQRMQFGIAALALAYLGLIGFLGYGMWQDGRKLTRLRQEIDELAPVSTAYSEHMSKWNELDLVVDNSKSPVELFFHVVSSIPPNSGLRLKSVELTAGEIKLIGNAPQSAPTTQFDLALSKKAELSAFKWQNPHANETNNNWEFTFTGSTVQ